MKVFKVLLIDGSIIGVEADSYEHKTQNPDNIWFYKGEKRVALFNFKNIMGITEFEEE